MNRFIIDEVQIANIEQDAPERVVLTLNEVRSHPYQSERDKVLDTDSVLAVLKKRYRNEMAILDYIEMIECEVMALRQKAGEP